MHDTLWVSKFGTVMVLSRERHPGCRQIVIPQSLSQWYIDNQGDIQVQLFLQQHYDQIIVG